jgi:hypothetical protein
MKITGTFIDEISHDIPHQNWGRREWDADFKAMKRIGINTVVMIRCGYRKWITYPSKVLCESEGCFSPSVDLVEMFLELSEKHGMAFYFGTYDSGKYWHGDRPEKEIELSVKVVDEVWGKYGSSSAFKGWYLSLECSRNFGKIIDIYAKLGRHCKTVSGNLPVLISPWIDGRKSVSASSSELSRDKGISIEQHEKEWNEILCGIKGAVDIVAFQDGHVDYEDLSEYLKVNKSLAEKHGLSCWTNIESFDRDMPIKFLPIKWGKLLYKMEAAEKAGIGKGITFEFSHFMSPNSMYPSAGHLYNRYREWLRIQKHETSDEDENVQDL